MLRNVKRLLPLFVILFLTACSFLNGKINTSGSELNGVEDLELLSFGLNNSSSKSKPAKKTDGFSQEDQSVYVDKNGNVQLLAQVKNSNRLSFVDIVLYSENINTLVVFNEGHGTYTCSTTTVYRNDIWVTDIILNVNYSLIDLSTEDCMDSKFIEIREITFLNNVGTSYKPSLSNKTITRLTFFYNNDVNTTGHEWGEWEIIEEPTCVDEGTKIRYCNHNHSHTDTSAVPALGHDLDDYYVCKRCGRDMFRAKVTYLNYDEKVLAEYVWLKDEEEPQYAGKIPTKPNSEKLSYSFEKFVLFPSSTDTDIIYIATFSEGSIGLQFNGNLLTGYTGYESEIVIPEMWNGITITTIDEGAFAGNQIITSITFSKNIKRIKWGAFWGCENLKTVNGWDSIEIIEAYAFAYTQLSGNIIFGNRLFEIWGFAFQNTAISSVVFPASLEMIDNGAFSQCEMLESVVFNDKCKLRIFGNECFGNCISLRDVNLPNYLEELPDSVFGGCTSLENIKLPTGLKTISYGAFSCTNVSFSSFPSTLIKIDNGAFCECLKMTRLELPQNLEYIGQGAFAGCANLEEISLNSNLRFIGDDAFYYCMSLTNVSIPSSVTNLGKRVFSFCSELVSAEIGSNIKIIDDGVFEDCSSLKYVVLPLQLNKIADSAFLGCSSLEFIYYMGTPDTWNKITLPNDSNPVTSTSRYYYSEDIPVASGNYWHYVNGVPTIWN